MTEHLDEPKANPYNAQKDWHYEDAPSKGSADSLFYDDSEDTAPQATSDKRTPKAKDSKETQNYKKRYDDLKKHYDEKIAMFKQKEQELLAMQVENAPAYQPPKSIEELEEFKSRYPDLYETVETVAHLQSSDKVKAMEEKLRVIEARESEIARKEAEANLRQRHPDFEDIRGDEAFHEWAKEQPDEIQRWIYNNPDDVGLASRAIDFYKMEKGIQIGKSKGQSANKPKASGADMVSTKTTTVDTKQPKIWTQREIAALSIDQYDRFEDEIDRAILEGRVVK